MSYLTIYAILVILVLPRLIGFCQFIYLHLLHDGKIATYLNSKKAPDPVDASWSLVTGASDGIGFGFVRELASRGFNVILHGRNEAKLEKLVVQIRDEFPSVSFKVFVLNATERAAWDYAISNFISELRESGLALTILINNVGGTGGSFKAFERTLSRDPKSIARVIDMNAAFPAVLTHALMPLLAKQRSLIINIGSVVALFPTPYLELYSGSKAFNLAWSKSLSQEMQAENLPVEVIGVVVGRVENATSKDKTGLFMPTSQGFAKATLDKVGCGQDIITAYWPHALQIMALNLLPGWIQTKALLSATKEEMANERRSQ